MLAIKIENFKALQSATERLQDFLLQCNITKDSVFDCKLVVTELVSNVLKHSDGAADVECIVSGDFVRLKIVSGVPFTPPEKSRCSDVYAEHGRGLFLVDSVCETRIMTEDGGILVTVKIQ